MEYRTKILNSIIDKYNFKNYLEIGVRNANENFNQIHAENKDGVDPAPITPCKYRMTSDEFFEKYSDNKTYDVVFVDGLHTAEQVYKDVINSLEILNENGFIVMHDCNPPSEYHARSYNEYLKNRGEWNGDVFKGFLKLKKELKDYDCYVVNEDFGCGVITKVSKTNDNYLDEIDVNNITWADFEVNRNELLSLITYDEFLKRIENDN